VTKTDRTDEAERATGTPKPLRTVRKSRNSQELTEKSRNSQFCQFSGLLEEPSRAVNSCQKVKKLTETDRKGAEKRRITTEKSRNGG